MWHAACDMRHATCGTPLSRIAAINFCNDILPTIVSYLKKKDYRDKDSIWSLLKPFFYESNASLENTVY